VNSHDITTPVINDIPKLEGVEDFALRSDVHVNTIRKWVNLGIIPAVRIGNVVRIDPVEAFAALKNYKGPRRFKKEKALA
jgi:hypothetical protein